MMKLLVLCALVATCYAFPQFNEFENRIVNGTNAKLGEFPYIVSMQLNNRSFCGASIIDATHILTAAHCVYFSKSTENKTIQYGVTDVRETINRIPIKKMVYHPDFEPRGGYKNDVAVLTLESEIEFSDTVQPTKLPEPWALIPEGAGSTLAGWGIDKSQGEDQNELKWVKMVVYLQNECEEIHEEATRPYHLCSGIPWGGQGQCSGDSGGPLYARGVQAGIVSWSKKPCGKPNSPGVFTHVANYVDWIKEEASK